MPHRLESKEQTRAAAGGGGGASGDVHTNILKRERLQGCDNLKRDKMVVVTVLPVDAVTWLAGGDTRQASRRSRRMVTTRSLYTMLFTGLGTFQDCITLFSSLASQQVQRFAVLFANARSLCV